MVRCERCRCAGRRKAVKDGEDGGLVAVYVCGNPRCTNYRQEIAEEPMPPSKADDESP